MAFVTCFSIHGLVQQGASDNLFKIMRVRSRTHVADNRVLDTKASQKQQFKNSAENKLFYNIANYLIRIKNVKENEGKNSFSNRSSQNQDHLNH